MAWRKYKKEITDYEKKLKCIYSKAEKTMAR